MFENKTAIHVLSLPAVWLRGQVKQNWKIWTVEMDLTCPHFIRIFWFDTYYAVILYLYKITSFMSLTRNNTSSRGPLEIFQIREWHAESPQMIGWEHPDEPRRERGTKRQWTRAGSEMPLNMMTNKKERPIFWLQRSLKSKLNKCIQTNLESKKCSVRENNGIFRLPRSSLIRWCHNFQNFHLMVGSVIKWHGLARHDTWWHLYDIYISRKSSSICLLFQI